MLEMTDQITAIVRASAPRCLLGIVVTTVGIAALLFYSLRKRSKDSAALWFGIFATLYGVRLLIETRLVRLALGMGDLLLSRMERSFDVNVLRAPF